MNYQNDEDSDLSDPATMDLVRRIHDATKHEGLARIQKALGIALWRTAAGHPSILMTADFRVEEIRLLERGTRLHVDMEVFPPFYTGDRNKRLR